MFARAKIKLADVPKDTLALAIQPGNVLVCDLQATNIKGHPSAGTIKAPAVHWRVGPSN